MTEGFTLRVDGVTVLTEVESTEAEIPLEGLSPGPHTLTVVAEGARTRYPLSRTELDDPPDTPLPVEITVPFTMT